MPWRPAWKKPQVGIEADRADGREAVLEQHGVGEGQQCVHRDRAAAGGCGLEVEAAARGRRLEHAAELAEVERGGLALDAQENGGIGMRSRRLSRSAMSRAAGSSLPRPFSVPFAASSRERDRRQRISSVRWLVTLALHHGLGQSMRARCGSAKRRYWSIAQRDILRRRRLERGDEAAVAGQVDDRDFAGVARHSRACVETWTLPKTTTWRMAAIGTRWISAPSLRTTRCSLRLPTWRPAPAGRARRRRRVCGITRVMPAAASSAGVSRCRPRQ